MGKVSTRNTNKPKERKEVSLLAKGKYIPIIFLDTVCTNLIVQASRIQGHEIRIVSYAHLDGGDCRFY